MDEQFFGNPILNSPYEYPSRHWELLEGQPSGNVISQRRAADFVTPIPKPRKRNTSQQEIVFDEGRGLSTASQQYEEVAALISGVRQEVDAWRTLPNERDWGVTPETAKLLSHWRQDSQRAFRPFFCQVEAVETVIWLTEVAPRQGTTGRRFLDNLANANRGANPELLRLALKLATGAGKTTVMAMLIAWQTINAVRHPGSNRFTRGFLVVTPGITIRDRLRVLQPNDPDSYYTTRGLIPDDMLQDLPKASIVITNFHALQRHEVVSMSSGGRALLKGRGPDLETLETEGQMVKRVMPNLMRMKNILVLNDEGHHCYREKPVDEAEEGSLSSEERTEAKKNNEQARVWINGLEAVKRVLGVRHVMDLSATPFFLRGSGYAEGTLFPWTVNDFSLMDAIESGIVKLPRVPISDNIQTGDMPRYRNLWENIRKDMPRKGRGRSNVLDPLSLPAELQTALEALYGHYEKTFRLWEDANMGVPPCFVIVCNNTATSKLVYDYVSGFLRENPDGTQDLVDGRLELFRNYDEHRNPRGRPHTLLIDSEQLESGDALDPSFRAVAKEEVDRFRRDRHQRSGNREEADNISDQDLLREVMNTVGKPDKLGESIRCVVSVSMLTEGWDANTVTHILGIRAFGTQLLCEQVVGRALRRSSYDLNDEGLFEVQYADILGVPFDFTSQPVISPPLPPIKTTQVKAVSPERDRLEITFPRVRGYRAELPREELQAAFTTDSVFRLTPEQVGPTVTRNEGIIGQGVDLNLIHTGDLRISALTMYLTKRLLETKFRDSDEGIKLNLYGPARRIVRKWLDEYLECQGGTFPAQLMYPQLADQACEIIMDGINRSRSDEHPIKALLDPYNPTGSTAHVSLTTSKAQLWTTDPQRCHINYVVLDSNWEAEFCRIAESHPRVRAYAKNHGLGLEVPYRSGSTTRQYLPDFILLVDDGHGDEDLLHLVVEIKGYRGQDAMDKKRTMDTYWVPGVNNLGRYGRWAFDEYTNMFDIEKEFDALIERSVARAASREAEPYDGMSLKELLSAAPLEGVDLERSEAPPRDISL